MNPINGKIHFENYMDISNCTVHLFKKLNNNQIWAVLYNIKDYHRFYTGYFTIQNGKYIWHQTAFQNIVNELFNDFALDNEGRVWAGGNNYIASYDSQKIRGINVFLEKLLLMILQPSIEQPSHNITICISNWNMVRITFHLNLL